MSSKAMATLPSIVIDHTGARLGLRTLKSSSRTQAVQALRQRHFNSYAASTTGTADDARDLASLGRRIVKKSTLGALSVRKPAPAKRKASMQDVAPFAEDPFAEDPFVENPLINLQRQVNKLERIDIVQGVNDTHVAPDAPMFSETDLLGLYEDILALPTEEALSVAAPHDAPSPEHNLQLLQNVYERLVEPSGALSLTSSGEDLPASRTEVTSSDSLHAPVASTSDTRLHVLVLSGIREVLKRMEAVKFQVKSTVPLGILSSSEWEALARVAITDKDGRAMEATLELMEKTGCAPSEDLLSDALSLYADVGDVVQTEAFMGRFISDTPAPKHRDLHIKAYIRSTPQYRTPQTALSLLHSYESRAIPAPIKSYNRTINALFAVRPPRSLTPSSQSSEESAMQAYAQSWDLFAHMRYAAHPTPDLKLYTTMIRACALPASGRTSPFSPLPTAEPERALDLWHEMTVDQSILPDSAAYEAIIAACARSGLERYVNEAFRLARECLDGDRDAHGRSRFAATPGMCRALLDGAKRVGALGRTRWILAEMIRVTRNAPPSEALGPDDPPRKDAVVDEETMMHVFHAYSSYQVPFHRSLAKTVDGPAENELDPPDMIEPASASDQAPSSSSSPLNDSSLEHHESTSTSFSATMYGSESSRGPQEINIIDPQFPTHVPQSKSEVIAEASFLFSRIVATQTSNSVEDIQNRDFSDVRLTPRLVNSYLSVYYQKASTDVCRRAWTETWAQAASCGVSPTGRSYVEALERCVNAKRGNDRKSGIQWFEELWTEWRRVEEDFSHGKQIVPDLNARTLEKVHVARIRMLCLDGRPEDALAHLKTFVASYPPRQVRDPVPASAMRSTRTVLVGAKPLVRLTAPTQVSDDFVPPILTFSDLDVLHHRLRAADHVKGVKYVGWVCKAYEGELRRRRERTLLPAEDKGTAVAMQAANAAFS